MRVSTKYRARFVSSVATLVVGLMSGCGVVEPEFECVNPLDPECSSLYVEPNTSIVGGPGNGATVDTHTVSFTYRGNNDNVVSYAYRLSQSIWSEWIETADTTVTFEYLEEGSHRFEVKAQYSAEDEDDTPAWREFVIDAVRGATIRFDQRRFAVAVGDTFVAIVFIEEIDSLKGVLAEIGFSQDTLMYIRGEIYTDHSSILMNNAGGLVISKFTPNSAAGTIKMEAATAKGDPPYVSGKGPIGQITFQAVQAGNTWLRFLPLTELRNADNKRIENVGKIQSLIEISSQ